MIILKTITKPHLYSVVYMSVTRFCEPECRCSCVVYNYCYDRLQL